jgi:AcrR family transcriptional regulator
MPRAVRANGRRLNFDQIVDAAAELIATEGFDAVTMRRLAEQCHVGVMTLYGYVRTKEEILGALADRFLGEIELPTGPGLSWDVQVAEVFRSFHRVLLAHPELAQIAVAQPIDGLAAYRGAEVVLGAFRRAGFSAEEAVSSFDALVCFTAGFTLRQLALEAPSVAPDRLRRLRALPSEEFPHIVELAPVFVARELERRFDDGLDVLIRGIASRAADQQRAPARRRSPAPRTRR